MSKVIVHSGKMFKVLAEMNIENESLGRCLLKCFALMINHFCFSSILF